MSLRLNLPQGASSFKLRGLHYRGVALGASLRRGGRVELLAEGGGLEAAGRDGSFRPLAPGAALRFEEDEPITIQKSEMARRRPWKQLKSDDVQWWVPSSARPTTILGRFQVSLPCSNDIFCVFKPSAQTHTVAPHCGSHCHQLRVLF